MLVLGGAKSGKSSFALNVCNSLNKKRIFLATAQALDQEMEERIRRHQVERGSGWRTIEEPLKVAETIGSLDSRDTVIVLDCLTLWLNNLYMEHGEDQEAIDEDIKNLARQLTDIHGAVVVVSNEVGMGIVPDNQLSRTYRDTAGYMNQRIVRLSGKVVAVLAGIPLVLKDE
ncbi:MAG: bifunctional adenosylcobinamide kinase/adenosylcobinamide-phosphate guanylyltransferase [Proteobacteria bacterium]|nr:bifunctional adenosylcobinamide kinase/adenosylcobinamide-phosphate guanylyltransferase [Pseudomonadota bacterium]